MLFHEFHGSGGPEPFLRGVATRVGLLYPYGLGRSRDKRIDLPVRSILDVLVKSCTPLTPTSRWSAFWTVLGKDLESIVGGRVSGENNDLELLRRLGVDISATDLEENLNAFVGHLADIGLARKYPDNIAYVGNYHA